MDRIKNALRRISIPAAFVICSIGCLVTALALTKVTVSFAKRGMTEIVSRYDDSVTFVDGSVYSLEPVETVDPGVIVFEGGVNGVHVANVAVLDRPDKVRIDFYAHMDEIAAILWYTVCLAAFALIFYRWKIRRPYRALMEAAGKIAANDLDFKIGFEGQDELGRLCRAFEVMRGHAEIIEAELDGREGLEDIKGSIKEISGQIDRLGSFVGTMGRIRRLEDYEPCAKPVPVSELIDLLTSTARFLYPAARVEAAEAVGLTLFTDKEALMQIYENVVSNAARHAISAVDVTLAIGGDLVSVCVRDDGAGFTSRDLDNASDAYYRGERTGNENHFGLGLYIGSVLAKKLGGGIILENAVEGGAKVTIKVKKDLRGI